MSACVCFPLTCSGVDSEALLKCPAQHVLTSHTWPGLSGCGQRHDVTKATLDTDVTWRVPELLCGCPGAHQSFSFFFPLSLCFFLYFFIFLFLSSSCLPRRRSRDETDAHGQEHCRPATESGRDHVQSTGDADQPQVSGASDVHI